MKVDVQLPAVWRPVKGKVRIKLPYVAGGANRRYLNDLLPGQARAELEDGGRYCVARRWLAVVVSGLLQRYSHVDVVLDHNPAMRCDTRCVNAESDDCVCSCMGQNHGGAGNMREWLLVGDTTLIEAGTKVVRRHMRAYRDQPRPW